MSSANASPSSSRNASPTPVAAPPPTVEAPSAVLKQDDVPSQVKEDLKEYLDLKEQIKGANEELKIFKERLKELEGDLTQYMEEHNVQFFNTPLGKVSFYQSKSMQPLNKDFFKEAFQSKIPDKTLANELTTMFEKRPFTETNRIKVFPKRRDRD